MIRRNFILLIIIIVIALVGVLIYFSAPKEQTVPGEGSEVFNFISQFNPFATSTNTPPTTPPPADISADDSVEVLEINLELIKISSMPIAGFTIFTKERLKEMPVPTETSTTPSVVYNFGTTTLKSGSTGEAVKELQKFFNNTLSLTLELDGVLDEKIATIIKQWQKDHNLTADGVVGTKTKTAMYVSVNQTTEITKPTPPATEFMTALRYVDRATGNIFQTFADKIEERKFSSTIIPKIYEAFFGNKGETVVMRYLKNDGRTISTFVGNLPKEYVGGDTTDNNEIKGTFLPDNILDLSLSSDTSNIFYLFKVGEGVVGTTLNLSTNKKVQIFDSPFTEWLSFWPNNKAISLTTKPSSGVPGYMYTLNLTNKNLNKTITGINGLTTLTSPDGKLILYGDNNLSLKIYHSDTKTADLLGIKTLPEKCVWGKASDFIYCGAPKSIETSNHPDAWYQGESSFADQIWKIDVITGNAEIIINPIEIVSEEIDAIKLALNPEENYLFFVNKKDSHLWELKLK